MSTAFKRSFAGLRFALLALAALELASCGSPEEKARAYYERGTKFLAEHDNARAGIEFRNAVKFKGDLIGAWRGLAQVEQANQHWAALVPILRKIVDLDHKDVESRLRLGRLLVLAGSVDEALGITNEAIGIKGNNADALALKATILLKLKDSEGAMREARAALASDPNNANARVVIAAEKLSNGDGKGALQVLDAQPTKHANDLGVQLFKIRIFEQMKDVAQVEAVLRKLIGLYPKESAFKKEIVKLYIQQHKLDDAERELRTVAAASPTNPEPELDLVGFLYAMKSPDAARQELRARIKAGGDVSRYQLALADLEFAQSNFSESERLLDGLIKFGNPNQILAAQTKLAEMDIRRKKLDAAEGLVNDILGKDARSTAGLRLRATIRMERGQLEAAITDLREALNDQPRSTELMLLLASAYERSGSIELAEKQFADATRASNFAPRVGLQYVAFLQRRASTQRAEDVLTELATRAPNNVEVLAALAQVKLTRQEWEGAEELAENIRKLGNGKAIADQILGAALSGRNKYDESIAVLQNAYAEAPNAAQPMFALVRAMMRAKQTAKAVAFLQTVLQANPTNAEAHVLLGSVRLASNSKQEAVQDFKTAIEKQPKDIVGYRALADFYLSQNDSDEAARTIRAGLAQMPENSVLNLSLANILELKGDFDGAIAEYEGLLTKEPGSLVAANNLASILSDHRTDKASLDRAQALAASLRNSPVPQFKDTLGWIEYQRGNYKNAQPLLEEAAAALPKQAVVHYHLAMSYIANGEPAKASEQLKTALARAPNAQLEHKIRDAIKKAGS